MSSFNITPHPHQIKGIEWMFNKEQNDSIKGGILADEVGLGKTIQSIGIILKNKKPKTLILVPKSLLNQWHEEINKFSTGLKVLLCDDKIIPSIDPNETTVVLASMSQIYGRTPKNTQLTSGYKSTAYQDIIWDRLIIDEAHSIKNRKSKIHKACVDIKASYRWLLTATPIMNRMTDFVNLMGFYGYTQIECQTKKIEIANKMILRRTKADVKSDSIELDLPPLDTTVCEVDFETKEERALYSQVFNKMKQEIKELKKEHNTNNVIEALERLLRIRQISIHPQIYYDGIAKKNKTEPEKYTGSCTKLNTLVKLLAEKPKEEKALVFCQFIKEIQIYKNRLEEEGYECLTINGSLTLEERTSRIEKFNTDPNKTVFLIQINTGGTGLNLQIANWVYITAPTWNPCMEYQAIGRSHRSGQKRQVNVKKIVINGDENPDFTYVEASIMALQEEKQKIVKEIMNDNSLDIGVKSVRIGKAAGNINFKQINKLLK